MIVVVADSPKLKALCGAKTKAGTPCQRPAGEGGETPGFGRCRWHLGRTESHRKAAAEQAARAHAIALGGQVSIDPHEAIQLCVEVAASEVVYFDARIAELLPGEVLGQAEVVLDRYSDRKGQTVETRSLPPALHVWVTARAGAIDRLARYAKLAVDMGVEERRAALAERQGAQLAAVVRLLVSRLGYSLSDPTVKQHVRAVLTSDYGDAADLVLPGAAALTAWRPPGAPDPLDVIEHEEIRA